MCKKDTPVLSILISSYNRSDRLMRNLTYMIQTTTANVEFIVGDNCSEDDTWAKLGTITDNRVRIYRNDENKGFINCFLLASHMKGKWFLTLNDRDYIEPEDIEKICGKLEMCDAYDILVTDPFYSLELAEGACDWKGAMWCVFEAIHPGWVIWKRKFILENHWDEIIKNQPVIFGKIVNSAYVWNHPVIRHSEDVNILNKTRIETYRTPYFAPSAVSETIMQHIEDAKQFQYSEERMEWLICCVYRAQLEQTTRSYGQNIDTPNFAKRYGYEGHTCKEWIANGLRVYKKIMLSKIARGRRIKITKLTWKVMSDYYAGNGKYMCVPRICSRKLYEYQRRRAEKFRRLFVLMKHWNYLKNRNVGIKDYLLDQGINRIAVYGISDVGKGLIDELWNTEIQVAYGIDRRNVKSYRGVEVVNSNAKLEDVDAVIVTAIDSFDEIRNNIGSKINGSILSIEDIILEMRAKVLS